jgi:hypothetical protein
MKPGASGTKHPLSSATMFLVSLARRPSHFLFAGLPSSGLKACHHGQYIRLRSRKPFRE